MIKLKLLILISSLFIILMGIISSSACHCPCTVDSTFPISNQNIKDLSSFQLNNILNEPHKYIKRIILIQSRARLFLYQVKHKKKYQKTKIKKTNKKQEDMIHTLIYKYSSEMEVLANNYKPKVTKNILDLEKKLGPFTKPEDLEQDSGISAGYVLPKQYSIKYPDNKIYIGYLNYNLKKEYYGILYFDSNKYEGYFKEDKMNGKGRLTYYKGDYYEGIYFY